MNLEGKIFQAIQNTKNGDVGSDTLFHYHQNGEIIWAEYAGGQIKTKHLLGTMEN